MKKSHRLFHRQTQGFVITEKDYILLPMHKKSCNESGSAQHEDLNDSLFRCCKRFTTSYKNRWPMACIIRFKINHGDGNFHQTIRLRVYFVSLLDHCYSLFQHSSSFDSQKQDSLAVSTLLVAHTDPLRGSRKIQSQIAPEN